MKDFDVARKARILSEDERTFKLHGETFVVSTGIHPDDLAEYDALDELTAVTDVLQVVDDVVMKMIDDRDNAHNRYRVIRADREDPITVEDLQDLVKWMMAVQTGRPTGQPSASAPGLPSTETGLTDVSFSPDIPTASAVST